MAQIQDGLEQWIPRVTLTCPVTAEELRHEVFPALQTGPPALLLPTYPETGLVSLVRDHPDLRVIRVRKRRMAYQVLETIGEYAEVLINGARVATIGVESTDPERVLRAVRAIGLDGVENINYLQAIKRIIGLASAPLANE
jgi:hypothetical protein